MTARRAGPDRCPGVLCVWPAADGGLARIRTPGGRLTGSQASVLAAAASDLGSGIVELTARANVQLRGLRPGAERELADRLRPAGLLPSEAHDRVRNIVASPLQGLDVLGAPAGRPDLGPLLAALDAGLCADPALARLPGRFLFGIDDGTADVTALGADVALFAVDGGYALLLGGTDPAIAVAAAGAADLALHAARAFLTERSAQGSPAWRLAELADGAPRVAARLPEFGARPAGGTGVPPEALTVSRPPALGAAMQGDGRIALVVGTAAGTLSARAVAELAAVADPRRGLRVTPWRSVVVAGLDPARSARVAARLAARGLLVEADGAGA